MEKFLEKIVILFFYSKPQNVLWNLTLKGEKQMELFMGFFVEKGICSWQDDSTPNPSTWKFTKFTEVIQSD